MFSFRKLACLAALSVSALLSAQNASATTLDFNSHGEGFFLGSVSEPGYTLNPLNSIGTTNNSLWPSNGTQHLLTWTNSANGSSGFKIQANDNSAFSISSFAFGSGYIGSYLPANSLTVSGTGGNGPFSQSFVSGVDYFDFGPGLTTLTLASGFNATEYTFTAFGDQNRSSFDDIVVGAAVNNTPEPGSLALLALGLVGLAVSRRKARAAN